MPAYFQKENNTKMISLYEKDSKFSKKTYLPEFDIFQLAIIQSLRLVLDFEAYYGNHHKTRENAIEGFFWQMDRNLQH